MSMDFLTTRSKRKRLADVLPLDTPFTVNIDPCGACNFSCGFCPCNTADFRNEDRHKMMSMELFYKIADDLAAFPQKIKVVNLYCFGEPLLNPNIPEMVRILRKKDVCNEIILVTNGSLLTPELNKQLAICGIDYIRISVEALSSDDYEKVCGKRIDFNRFLSNIEDLHDQCGVTTRIHSKCVNAMLKDESDLKRFHELFEPISDFISVENVEDWWGDFKPLIQQDAVKVVSNIHYGGKICTRPLIHMIIHSNGEISACCNDWKFATVYGDVNAERLVDAWNGKRLREFQLMHLEGRRYDNDFCAKCKFFCNDNIDEDAELVAQTLRNLG